MTTCMFLYVITRQYLVTVMNKKEEDHENKEKKKIEKEMKIKLCLAVTVSISYLIMIKKNIKKNYFTFNMYYW